MAACTALVTGATGFVGSHLVPHLLGEGYSVRATGRRPRPGWLAPAAEYVALDLVEDDADRLRGALDGISHVFHLAGASSSTATQEEMDRANVEGTRRLLAAAHDGALERFVHMSSTSVYGEEVQLPQPVYEDVEPHPSRGYGKAKWATEGVVWERARASMPVAVVRPVTVYGPGNVKLLASVILDVAIERSMGLGAVVIPAEPVEQRLVHIDDLVRATAHVAVDDGAVGRAFNVVGETYPSSHEVARIVAKAFDMAVELSEEPACGPSFEQRSRAHDDMVARGLVPTILVTGGRFRFLAKANRNNRVSVDALTGTGFRFRETDFEASVTGTVEWYREHRWVL